MPIRFALSFLVALALAGCVVAPAGPPVVYQPGPVVVAPGAPAGPPVMYQPAPVVVAPVAPPPLVVEPIVVAPSPLHIWIGGYWSWHGGRHVWTRGHWAVPPPGQRHWVPRQWAPGPGGWHQRGGHWSR